MTMMLCSFFRPFAFLKPLRHRCGLVLFCLAFCTAIFGPAGAKGTEKPESRASQWRVCAEAVAAAEARSAIPGQLLAAVALAESGRYRGPDRASSAWPWTVTSGKNSWFLDSAGEAVAKVRHLRQKGITNIDVGCMQINLHYHPRAFGTLEAAFDPATNIAYAADFLLRLHDAHRSWSRAVGHYHSATPQFQKPYRKKVMRLWNEERRRAAERHRQQVIAAFEERRRARQAAQAERRAALQAD